MRAYFILFSSRIIRKEHNNQNRIIYAQFHYFQLKLWHDFNTIIFNQNCAMVARFHFDYFNKSILRVHYFSTIIFNQNHVMLARFQHYYFQPKSCHVMLVRLAYYVYFQPKSCHVMLT